MEPSCGGYSPTHHDAIYCCEWPFWECRPVLRVHRTTHNRRHCHAMQHRHTWRNFYSSAADTWIRSCCHFVFWRCRLFFRFCCKKQILRVTMMSYMCSGNDRGWMVRVWLSSTIIVRTPALLVYIPKRHTLPDTIIHSGLYICEVNTAGRNNSLYRRHHKSNHGGERRRNNQP